MRDLTKKIVYNSLKQSVIANGVTDTNIVLTLLNVDLLFDIANNLLKFIDDCFDNSVQVRFTVFTAYYDDFNKIAVSVKTRIFDTLNKMSLGIREDYINTYNALYIAIHSIVYVDGKIHVRYAIVAKNYVEYKGSIPYIMYQLLKDGIIPKLKCELSYRSSVSPNVAKYNLDLLDRTKVVADARSFVLLQLIEISSFIEKSGLVDVPYIDANDNIAKVKSNIIFVLIEQ